MKAIPFIAWCTFILKGLIVKKASDMTNLQIPEYVDPSFIDLYQQVKAAAGDDKDSLDLADMLERIITSKTTASAWKQINKQKVAFIRDKYGAQGEEYMWHQEDEIKSGYPVSGDYCDIESIDEIEDAYAEEVILQLFRAFLQGFDLLRNGEGMARPDLLVEKAKRVGAAVIEMRESLIELSSTPQFPDFVSNVERRNPALCLLAGKTESGRREVMGFQALLDLWEKTSEGYIEALNDKTSSGFKEKPYITRLILKVFNDAFGKSLHGTTAKFASIVLGDVVNESDVAKISKRTDFKTFIPHNEYSLKGAFSNFK